MSVRVCGLNTPPMRCVQETAGTMAELRDLGVELSVDDFGTGYSSLSDLSSPPISNPKINRSFISGMQEIAAKSEIVRSVIMRSMARSVPVIAGGIEEEIQFHNLKNLGCDYGQRLRLSWPPTPPMAGALLTSVFEEIATAGRQPGLVGPGPEPEIADGWGRANSRSD